MEIKRGKHLTTQENKKIKKRRREKIDKQK